jgi:hypothetical protein
MISNYAYQFRSQVAAFRLEKRNSIVVSHRQNIAIPLTEAIVRYKLSPVNIDNAEQRPLIKIVEGNRADKGLRCEFETILGSCPFSEARHLLFRHICAPFMASIQ